MPAHDLTVTAQWSALPVYQVSFDSQGGSVSTQNIIEGQTATEPADPIKEGKEFVDGLWNLTDDEPYDFATLLQKQ